MQNQPPGPKPPFRAVVSRFLASGVGSVSQNQTAVGFVALSAGFRHLVISQVARAATLLEICHMLTSSACKRLTPSLAAKLAEWLLGSFWPRRAEQN